ncbi:MAG: hypothetical protein HYZ51_04575, partial [Candidatus Doudnabacteria bacterium]|nr:hypothetical protein [Candidatus Doudnabacteria bacterium]
NETIGDAFESLLAYPALAGSSLADTYFLVPQIPDMVSTGATYVSNAVSFLSQTPGTQIPTDPIAMASPALGIAANLFSKVQPYLSKVIEGGKMVGNWIGQTSVFTFLQSSVFKPVATIFQFLGKYLPVLVIINGALQLLRKKRVFSMQADFLKKFDLSILNDLADYETNPNPESQKQLVNKLKKLPFLDESSLSKIVAEDGSIKEGAKGHILKDFYQKLKTDYLSVTDAEKAQIRKDVEKEMGAKIEQEVVARLGRFSQGTTREIEARLQAEVDKRVQETIEMKATKLGKITGNWLLGEINKEIDLLTGDLSEAHDALAEAEKLGNDLAIQVRKKRLVEILDTLTYLCCIAFGITTLLLGSASGVTFVFFIAIWVGFLVTYLAEKQLLSHRGAGPKFLHTSPAEREAVAAMHKRRKVVTTQQLLPALAHYQAETDGAKKIALERNLLKQLADHPGLKEMGETDRRAILQDAHKLFDTLIKDWEIYLPAEEQERALQAFETDYPGEQNENVMQFYMRGAARLYFMSQYNLLTEAEKQSKETSKKAQQVKEETLSSSSSSEEVDRLMLHSWVEAS